MNISCEIQLGDIQSEEERDIVLQLALPAVEGEEVEEQGPVMRASLSYFDILSSTLVADLTAELLVARRGMTQWQLILIQCSILKGLYLLMCILLNAYPGVYCVYVYLCVWQMVSRVLPTLLWTNRGTESLLLLLSMMQNLLPAKVSFTFKILFSYLTL